MKITQIRLRRLNLGIEQEDAMKQLGISESFFRKIEQGWQKPGANVIARMAKLYKCSIDDIFKDLKITG